MKVLVTVASRRGSTREIARSIAEVLRMEGFDADLRDAGDVTSIGGYDALVLGSAVYMGGWLSEARRLARLVQSQPVALPLWLFSSGPLGADDPQPGGEPSQLAQLITQTRARAHHVFAGKLDRDDLGARERLIVRMVHAPQGDFRDWLAIRQWASQIATDLRSISAVVR